MPKVAQIPNDQPFWTAPGGEATIYHGHVLDVLRQMPSRSAHCCVTSPPYWGLRDYATGTWEGGDPSCDHVKRYAVDAARTSMLGPKRLLGISLPETNSAYQATSRQFAATCDKCGAKRIDNQIGSEETPEEFITTIVEVLSEVRRILRRDGTCWLNLGDTFLSSGNLCMIPARVALALQADGWVLRQDIIWYSPNKMPESVQNRCTKSHEHIFLLTQGTDYYFDNEAIKEPAKSEYRSSDFIPKSDHDKASPSPPSATGASSNGRSDNLRNDKVNKRDVWVVPTKGYHGAHFATYSPELITPCILAGTSEYGGCAVCGAPYYRVVEKTAAVEHGGPKGSGGDRNDDGRGQYAGRGGNEGVARNRNGVTGSLDGEPARTVTKGWAPSCSCNADTVGCTVIDPFVGSGTTPATAITLGRRGIGIDLSEEYLREHAVPRCEAAIATGKVVRQLVKVEPAQAAEVARPNVVRFGET
jgi:DNA modification methylase